MDGDASETPGGGVIAVALGLTAEASRSPEERRFDGLTLQREDPVRPSGEPVIPVGIGTDSCVGGVRTFMPAQPVSTLLFPYGVSWMAACAAMA